MRGSLSTKTRPIYLKKITEMLSCTKYYNLIAQYELNMLKLNSNIVILNVLHT